MPRRYRKRQNRRPRRYPNRRYRRRKNYRNRQQSRMVPITTGLPDATYMKLKYTSFITLAGTPTASYVFAGNSCYDPDVTSTGLQPLGFDQWSAFYERYLVYGSSIKVHFLNNNNAAPNANILLNVTPTDDNVARTYREWDNYPFNRSKMVGLNTGGYSGAYIKNYMSTKKIYGETHLDDVYQADVTNNPNRAWYWHIQADAFDQTSAISLSCKVEITYYVKMTQRVELTTS